ncbi:mRNA-capping enzyme-like [Dorcoceras hygrometricum]|uniref:mRNA-capping enzyme-like n=1 Tax=Dorcoceras hygrometricum TaxID=472368 RepID=A0A2Z7AZ67_9LAMI|nr:mRNA-capping enzyme-like [Dorcoceras hygrometricum]
MGNTDPNNTKAGKEIRGQASISPGTANLKPSHTGHGNSAVSLLEVQIQKLTQTAERSSKISQKASNEQALRQQQPDVAFLFAHQNDAASTNRNDVAALHQLIPNYIKTTNGFCTRQSKPRRKEYVSITANSRRNQQLVTNSSQLVPEAIPKTQRFNLSKRCRLTSTTGSSNQQLVTQSQPHSHNATTASSNLYKCN